MKTVAILVISAFGLVLMGQTTRPDLSFLTPEAREAFQAANYSPLPKPPEPANNRSTPAKIQLGHLLYFESRLSADGTISCASCHHPMKAWADGEKTSPGIHGKRGEKNSPTVLDSAFYKKLFWDQRAGSLEEQALGPVQNPVEMGNTLLGMIANLDKIPEYKPLFKKAFADEKITAERVAMAIAAFERTVISGPSAFDRFLGGDSTALNAQQKRGLEVFLAKGECTGCHSGAFFTRELRLAGVRVPTLRNVALTAPYFSDGSAATLLEAVAMRSPKVLTAADHRDIAAFLDSLSGELPNIHCPHMTGNAVPGMNCGMMPGMQHGPMHHPEHR